MSLTSSRQPRTVARAEPVGSLLRSPQVLAAMNKMYERETTPLRERVVVSRPELVAELQHAADEQVGKAIQPQIDAGLDVITDGEVRRSTFLGSLYDACTGMEPAAERLVVHNDAGEVESEWLNEPVLARRLRKAYSPILEEITFLRSRTDFPFKVTLPAPSYFFADLVSIEGSSEYSTKLELVEDIVEAEKLLAAEAVAAGARWIQFDFPIYPALAATSASSDFGIMLEHAGGKPDWILEQSLRVDREVTEGLPDDVTVAMHICRGNFDGGFWNGSLEPVAERMLNELPYERFLIEWEDPARDGDYSPIRFTPKGKIVALGLVSTKTPDLEPDDAIVGHLEEASKHLDIDQLALCPQCGFASLYADHLVTAEDAQWRKLELVGRVADRVWGV